MSRANEPGEGGGSGNPSRAFFHQFYRGMLFCRRNTRPGWEAAAAGCASALEAGDHWILSEGFQGGTALFPGRVGASGRCVSLASGAALRLRNDGFMAMALEGAEGLGAGLFYEGLLFAREQRLPVVAVTVTAGDAPPLFDAGIPAYSADGKDILDVYRWTRQAAEEARSGGGPRMVHLRLWKPEEDPVERYRKVLQLEGLMDEGEQRAIEASASGGRA